MKTIIKRFAQVTVQVAVAMALHSTMASAATPTSDHSMVHASIDESRRVTTDATEKRSVALLSEPRDDRPGRWTLEGHSIAQGRLLSVVAPREPFDQRHRDCVLHVRISVRGEALDRFPIARADVGIVDATVHIEPREVAHQDVEQQFVVVTQVLRNERRELRKLRLQVRDCLARVHTRGLGSGRARTQSV